MKKYLKVVLPLLVALTASTGCRLTTKVLPPPSYDDACQPSDSIFLEWAMDTQDLPDMAEIPTDPQAAYDADVALAETLGLQLVRKQSTGEALWDGFTTTFPDRILLGVDWDDKPIEARAATMSHELVHKRQWDRLGREAFLARYVTAAGRWSIEVQAYRQSIRMWKHFGKSDADLRKAAEHYAESLYAKYYLEAGMPECTKGTTAMIITMDLAA
jgi:hypothetical protein